jgi:hypothetical protein
MMAYLCKGTDIVTHSKLHGPRHIKARKQGIITWKRCGTTQNLGISARAMAGFPAAKAQNFCAKTSPQHLNVNACQRTTTNTSDGDVSACPTYVVSQTLETHLQFNPKHGSRERVASGDLDASRHALPDPLMHPDPCASTGL